MRGFFTFAKSFIKAPMMKSQQLKLTFRLANQQMNHQFRLCSTLATLRLTNLYGVYLSAALDEGDGGMLKKQLETDVEVNLSQVLSLSLKAEQNTIRRA